MRLYRYPFYNTSIGRRTALQRADGAGDTFHYDAKDQLTSAGYEVPGADPANTAQSTATFAYDPMGNRSRFEDRSHPAVTYTANALNQYTAVSAFNTPPAYDPDGNLTRREDRALTWNAENRLLRDEPAFPKADDQRVRYAYDPIGRRVRRSVDTFDGTTWSLTKDTHYSYWNWNVIEEHRALASAPSETRRYVWGEDLSDSFQGAGGVGGLLAQEYGGTRWFYHYDGNGNVTELSDDSGTTVASYRYTAFGQLRSSSGSAAEANDYRFSTKPYDPVSECYYYGYRYYDPVTGRWLNRDPIGEDGGLNLYAMVDNDPVNHWDVLGMTNNLVKVPWLAIEYFRGGSLNLSIGYKTPQLLSKAGRLIQKALSAYESYEAIVALGGTAQPVRRLWKSVPKCYVPKDIKGIKRAGFTKITRHWFNQPLKRRKPIELELNFTLLYLDIDYWRSVEIDWIPAPNDPCCK